MSVFCGRSCQPEAMDCEDNCRLVTIRHGGMAKPLCEKLVEQV